MAIIRLSVRTLTRYTNKQGHLEKWVSSLMQQSIPRQCQVVDGRCVSGGRTEVRHFTQFFKQPDRLYS